MLAGAAESPRVDLAWELPTGLNLPQALVCDVSNTCLFAALKAGGIAVFDLRAGKPPVKLATVPRAQLGQLDAMNLFLHGRTLLVALGDFFSRKSPAGLALIDVGNPRAPVVLSVWKSPAELKGSAVVVGDGRFAYLGAMSEGVLTFDVTNPRSIKHLATFKPDAHFPRRNPNAVQHPNARGMAFDGNHLFLAYDAGGLRVLDLSNPANPREISRHVNAGMRNRQQAYNNIVIDGKIAYVAVDYAGLEILDISNPRQIRALGWWNPWGADTLKNVWFNSPGHANQLHLDRSRKLVYLSAGDSELQIVNVANPARPQTYAAYGQARNGLGVWGLAAGGDTLYLAYINALVPFRGTWSGIKAVTVKHAR